MSSDGSITRYLNLLKGGDHNAAQPLWEAYFARLVGLARAELQRRRRIVVADEQDVALSAFDSFCRRAQDGAFPRLDDRDDLWHVLLVLTQRKAWLLRRRENRLKRGGGRVVPFADLDDGDLGDFLGNEPSPAISFQLAQELELRLECLKSDSLRQVAIWKLEGYTNREIAERLGCVEQTVERKLKSIRKLWSDGEEPSS